MRANFGFILSCLLWSFVAAETHSWDFNVTWVKDKNPDGVFPRDVVGFNNEWPLPTLRVKKGDRVLVNLTNGLGNSNTSLHFHGLFQPGSNQMDGPEMITQCPIPPGSSFLYNFTVGDQVGTYWYHSHTSGQYGDGMRGVFIIDDDDFPYDYDEDVVLTLGEWYHDYSPELTASFLDRYNPTGAEPIPLNFLFNETRNVSWNVEPGKTYLLHIINTGRFTSHYLWMEDHEFEIVEVDGIYVEKNATSLLYITVAQRYTCLVKTKNSTDRNYAFMMKVDDTMLDTMPEDLVVNSTNYIVYNQDLFDQEKPEQATLTEEELEDYFDDFYLQPLEKIAIYDDADQTIVVDVVMDNLGNGVNYAFFNNITYTAPKVPVLMTALSAGSDATNALVYGTNTNSFVLGKDEIIDIVVNNHDTGKHPFHLHGHAFQLIERHPAVDDNDDPIDYNATDHAERPEYPMRRDTVYVLPQAYMVLRFKADHPGVWFFHCHIEWHLDQGLALVLVEQPEALQEDPEQQITDYHKEVCNKVGIPYEGNAAANKDDFLDLKGQNVQVAPLPAGFTARGIVALVFSCIAGFLGIVAIAIYGMADIKNIELEVVKELNVDIADEEDALTSEGNSSSIENTK